MRSALGLAALAAATMVTAAASAAVTEADIVECAAIVADKDRLACYDAVADKVSAAADIAKKRRVEAAEAARQAEIAAAEAARRAAEEAEARKVREFGAESTALRSELEADKLPGLTAKVTEAFTDPYGYYAVLLDNGQLWKQLDGKLLTVRIGDEVVIERGLLGSYNLKIPRQNRRVKAKRLK